MEHAISQTFNVPYFWIDTGTRYNLVPVGFPSPPTKFSSKAIVCDHVSTIFPCPDGRWSRKGGEPTRIIFSCSCPIPSVIRLSVDNVSPMDSCIDYYVPVGQGIPHLKTPPLLGDSMAPWEIDILKEIVISHPNIQPMLAYESWTNACANHVDSISRCPDPIPGISIPAQKERTL
jgi:hypothetical protein